MEQYNFKIKIADLLLNPWQEDTISFENKITKNIENLQKEWISWKVYLQSITNNSLFVELRDIKAYIKDICDICWKEFNREANVKSFSSKFVTPEIHHDITEKIHDDEFFINTKDETIDIEEIITQSIILEEPIIKKCNECIKKEENIEDEDNIEEELNENKVNWINVKK